MARRWQTGRAGANGIAAEGKAISTLKLRTSTVRRKPPVRMVALSDGARIVTV